MIVRNAANVACTVAGAFMLTATAVAPVNSQTIDDVAIAGDVVLEDRYPTRTTRFPNGVTGLSDVVFASHTGYRPLTLDLYLPPGADTTDRLFPLVVVVHGGGWQSGHTRHFGAFADWPVALAAIAGDGFVVASVEYRLSREAPFPAAFDDTRDAVRWLRANTARYGIDKDRIVIMGGSAGGQLAGLVGTACGDKVNPGRRSDSDEPAIAESACVQGVVAWYGVFDFNPIVASVSPVPDLVGRYLGCDSLGCTGETVSAASAIDWVDGADPPFLMIHGVDDPVVSVEQSRNMDAALKDAGVDSRLIEIPGVKHSFVGDSPEATVKATRQAWNATIAFLREVLREEQTASR